MVGVIGCSDEPDVLDFCLKIADDSKAIQYAKVLRLLPKPNHQQVLQLQHQQAARKRGQPERLAIVGPCWIAGCGGD